MGLDASAKLELESYDDTNDESRIGAGDTAIGIGDPWTFVVATFDGADADASMNFYVNGVADGSGNVASDASYAAQLDTAGLLTIGATLNSTPTVTRQYTGRVALPFVCGKVLTADNCAALYTIGQALIGA